jgi:hypothetical protein
MCILTNLWGKNNTRKKLLYKNITLKCVKMVKICAHNFIIYHVIMANKAQYYNVKCFLELAIDVSFFTIHIHLGLYFNLLKELLINGMGLEK